jgi:hypothetical protein
MKNPHTIQVWSYSFSENNCIIEISLVDGGVSTFSIHSMKEEQLIFLVAVKILEVFNYCNNLDWRIKIKRGKYISNS